MASELTDKLHDICKLLRHMYSPKAAYMLYVRDILIYLIYGIY